MTKTICILCTLLLAGNVMCASLNKPAESRMAGYRALEKQRQELLDWAQEHVGAPYWSTQKRINQAKKIRSQMYTQFQDVELWRIGQLQQKIKTLKKGVKNLPFFPFNSLPPKNLSVMAQNDLLLLMLLDIYPDNAANIPAGKLLPFLAKDENLEKYLTDYVDYLESYKQFPACVEKMDHYNQNQIKYATENKRANRRLMSALANGCQKYAQKQMEQKQIQANNARLAQNIRRWQNENKKKKTLSFPFLRGESNFWQ